MTMTHGTQNTNTSEFRSSDLALAAYLALTNGIVRIDRFDPRKAVFCFNRDKALDRRIDAFWADEAATSPRGYFEKIRELKARIYAER